MARLPRFFVPGQPLHVVQRGNNRQPIFLQSADWSFFYGCLLHGARANRALIHAYVFMPNHLHLVVTPSSASCVPKMMQSVGRVYVAYFNRLYSRTGTLWEGRYKAAIIEDERYLLSCMRYVELNPVRAKLAVRPEEYRWSSFRANGCGSNDPLVASHPIYEAMGTTAAERRLAYRAWFGDAVEEGELRDIRDATQNAWALGSSSFGERVTLAARRAHRLPLGRPRKAPASP